MPHHIPCVTCAPFSYQFRALFWKKGEKICFVPLLLFLICMYVNVQLYWILFLVKKKKKQNIQKKKKNALFAVSMSLRFFRSQTRRGTSSFQKKSFRKSEKVRLVRGQWPRGKVTSLGELGSPAGWCPALLGREASLRFVLPALPSPRRKSDRRRGDEGGDEGRRGPSQRGRRR